MENRRLTHVHGSMAATGAALIILSTVLFIGGYGGVTVLVAYFGGHRSHTPQPPLQQTVRLPWTHPSTYGTPQEAALMVALFSVGFYSMVPFALGWAIRIYLLDEDAPIRGQKPRFGHLTRAPRKDRSA